MYAKLSKEITSEAKIQVDNAFFTDFMPFAPENYVKVYLYGLSLAYLADETVRYETLYNHTAWDSADWMSKPAPAIGFRIRRCIYEQYWQFPKIYAVWVWK